MRISVREIQDTVSRNFNVPSNVFRSRCRDRRVAWPRQVAMLLARELTPLSLPAIAREFGRDHTTIIYGIEAASKRIEADPKLANKVASIRHVIKANAPGSGRDWARIFNHIEDPISRKLTIIAKRERGELTDLETRELIRRCDLVNA